MSSPTKEHQAQVILNKQMDLLADRVAVVTERARNNARHLPSGDTRVYVSYIRHLAQLMVAQFEAGEPVPRFGSMFDLDGSDD